MTEHITDHWRIHQFVGLLIITAILCWWFSKRWGMLAGLAFWWTLVSALLNFANPWAADFPKIQLQLDTTSGQAFVITVLAVSFVANISREGLDKFYRIFEVAIFLNCLLLLYRGFGVFNAYSMDTAVGVTALPMMFTRYSKNMVWNFAKCGLPLICVGFYGGATAYFALIASIFGVAFYSKKWKILLLVVFVSPLAFLVSRTSGGLLSPGSRTAEWKRLMGWWVEHGSYWAGTGSGTFEWLSAYIQVNAKAPEVYLFLHNDYLQALFEQGIIGVILYGCVCWKALKGSNRAAPWVMPTMFSIGVLALTMYPMRFMLSQIFVLAVLREGLECSQRKNL